MRVQLREMKERQDSLQQVKSRDFDLLVIGGGIAGAGIAQNAALRGLSVLLLDKGDFASGSSSRSNQLIHGDLPYLEQLRFNLTRQLSEERERLKRLAPHLVKDISFILPLIRNNTFFNLKATVGLGLYDVLSMSARLGNTHAYLNRKKLDQLAPALSAKNISGGIQFQDALTDDARLVLSVLKSAIVHGAQAINYVQATGFRLDSNGKITQVECHDRYSGEEFLVSCKLCVNASGVWSDNVQELLPDAGEAKLSAPLKSTSIIVPASAFEINTALLLPEKEGRFVYVLPWHHAILIGSAVTSAYHGEFEQLRSSQDEIDHLLSVVNGYCQPDHQLNRSDVKSSFSKLTARLKTASEHEDSHLQEHAFFESSSGLCSVIGVKLSNYRIIAQELMERLAAKNAWLGRVPANTELAMLGNWSQKEDYAAKCMALEIKSKRLSIDPASIDHLISNYGAEAEHVLELIEGQAALKERIVPDFPVIMAEVPYSIVGEMTISLQDFMLRRCRLGMLNHKQALAAAPRVAELMGKILSWDSYRLKLELSAFEQEISQLNEIEKVDPVGI